MNCFDEVVEMFSLDGADSLLLQSAPEGIVAAVPFDSERGVAWEASVLSSAEELAESKYPVYSGEGSNT